MNEQDRELLFIDLCGRVPYEVIVCIDGTTNIKLASVSYWEEVEVQDGSRYLYDISEIKPYLFPMSSMTEEQDREFSLLQVNTHKDGFLYVCDCANMMKWLLKNHFDIYGLIEKGLAINATNLNIY